MTPRTLSVLIALMLSAVAKNVSADPTRVAYVDRRSNLMWAQPGDFLNVSRYTLQFICIPECKAGATLNGHDLTGWRLANDTEFVTMLTNFAADRNLDFTWGIGGWPGTGWLEPFSAAFIPTETNAFGVSFWAGWTDTPIYNGLYHQLAISPMGALVAHGHLTRDFDFLNGSSPRIGIWFTKPAPVPNPYLTNTPPAPVSPSTARRGDWDGDGKADPAVYRASNGTWYVNKAGGGTSAYGWGLDSDVPAPGDYDGDGKMDIAVYRPSSGEWFICWSASGFATYTGYTLGAPADIPVPADYDGDHKADIAVYRPSTGEWLVLKSSSTFTTTTTHAWGAAGDRPVPGDYDGDGKTDPAVYRPSTGGWWILKSTSGYFNASTYAWGLDGDRPVPADYDGDGKTDVAIYRASSGGWWILTSTTGFNWYTNLTWGAAADVPEPADYDGDGASDAGVYRPSNGTWYVLQSGAGFTTSIAYAWGLDGDQPLLSATHGPSD